MKNAMRNNVDYDPNNPHIRTFTDKRFYLLDIKPEDIDIRDIAHSLSHICRYGGHCNRFFSVGEHSIRCSDRGSDWLRKMWGLLHDAAEAYIGDFTRPLKRVLYITYPLGLLKMSEYEKRILQVIATKFKLPFPIPGEVGRTDTALLYEEMIELWDCSPGRVMDAKSAEQMFLDYFEDLEKLRPDCHKG